MKGYSFQNVQLPAEWTVNYSRSSIVTKTSRQPETLPVKMQYFGNKKEPSQPQTRATEITST